MYDKIVVPLDGSELAEGVIPHVAEIVRSGIRALPETQRTAGLSLGLSRTRVWISMSFCASIDSPSRNDNCSSTVSSPSIGFLSWLAAITVEMMLLYRIGFNPMLGVEYSHWLVGPILAGLAVLAFQVHPR